MPYKDPNSPAAIESRRKACAKWYQRNKEGKCGKRRERFANDPQYAQDERDRNKRWKSKLSTEKRCVNCGKSRDREGKTFCSACWPLHQERMRKVHAAIKTEVLGHYSNGEPRCACCGETILEFLSIDHIGGGGSEHRRKLGGGGTKVYYFLRADEYPEGYRVLCHNCNQAIGAYGSCPHERERLDATRATVSSPGAR